MSRRGTPRVRLPRPELLTPIDAEDPANLYFRPVLGWLFRQRLEMAVLTLRRTHYARVLEIGSGSGVFLPTLAGLADGVIATDRKQAFAKTRGLMAVLGSGVVLARCDARRLPFASGSVDLVVCMSVMEHLARPSEPLGEMWRVLRPLGELVIGMPAVSGFMNGVLEALKPGVGMRRHHVTTPTTVLRLAHSLGGEMAWRTLPPFIPVWAAGYTVIRVTKATAPEPDARE